jgi:hypothetical protein
MDEIRVCGECQGDGVCPTIQDGSSGTFCERSEVKDTSPLSIQCPIDLGEEYLHLGKNKQKGKL